MDGQREDRRGIRGGTVAAVIVFAVIAVLAGVYLGLCTWVSASGKVMPNVTVAGNDVSDMTEEEVMAKVQSLMSDNRAVELKSANGSTYLTGDCFQIDADRVVRAVMTSGRSSFLASGAQYISHMLNQRSLTVGDVSLTETGVAELKRQLDAVDAAGADLSTDYQMDLEAATLTFTKGYTRMGVDRAAVQSAVLAAFARYTGGDPVVVELNVEEQPPMEPDFEAIHQQIYAKPVDAHVSEESQEVVEGTPGVDFDIAQARSAFQAAAEGATYTVPLTITQPEETAETLSSRLFADLLGEGSTKVSGSANRKHNVKTSAEACNGKVIPAGGIFSYNTTTGSRSEENGYKNAPVYLGGRSEDGMGGGTCQVSSTIYYAVLHTTLEVVERHNHEYDTGYVDPGMDATVYFGTLDFRFKNNTEDPIKIVTDYSTRNGADYISVKIYGTNPSGRYAEPESTTYDKVSPTTVYVARDSVTRGQLVLDREQNAYTGISATTYRNIYEKDGTLVEKQEMGTSKYSMRPNTYYYNPADGDPSTWVNGRPSGNSGNNGNSEEETQQPSTQRPSTQQPSTQRPSTQQPSTERPSTQRPNTQQPNTQEPTNPEPSTPEPSTPEPSTPEPSTPEPSTPEPSTPEPSTPSTNEPPVEEEPSTPVIPEPAPPPENPGTTAPPVADDSGEIL